MEIFPAIDILGGQAVRLTQGDYQSSRAYYKDPLEAAQRFCAAGARRLHIVDLDGARSGSPANMDAIRRLAAGCKASLQVGGGVRDEARICALLGLGVSRVILGTAAAADFDWAAAMIAKYGRRIAAGVDARDGMVAVKGWTESGGIRAADLCSRLDAAGVERIIYTDISRDGTMEGPNTQVYSQLKAQLSCKIIASGGVACLADFQALGACGADGVIIGKALYSGAFTLEEAIKAC